MACDGDHLRDDEPRAVAPRLQAHEPVADPRQRREHHAVGDGQAAEGPRIGQAHATVRVRAVLVIFDCDGVLVDSEVLSNAALAEALAEVGARR